MHRMHMHHPAIILDPSSRGLPSPLAPRYGLGLASSCVWLCAWRRRVRCAIVQPCVEALPMNLDVLTGMLSAGGGVVAGHAAQ
jgi:hypothetical protein